MTLTDALLRELFPGTGGFSQYIDEDLQDVCEKMMPDYKIKKRSGVTCYETLDHRIIATIDEVNGNIYINHCKERLLTLIEIIIKAQIKRHYMFK